MATLRGNTRAETCYLTHDNGGRPFKVCFTPTRFWVLKPRSTEGDGPLVHDTVAVKPTPYARVFVGRSPRNATTEYSKGYGPKFDGNSMLFETEPGKYTFVGERVTTFRTRSPVETFVSPVGNNDVPYPFAVDRAGVAYLLGLTESVQVTAGSKEAREDPITYYYDKQMITPDLGMVSPRPVEPFEGITHFYVGSQPYTFTYAPFPDDKFERLSRSRYGRGGNVYVVAHGKKKRLLKKDFVDLMQRFGKARGFAPFRQTVVVPRLW